jgi:hypothetical protein
MFLIKIFQDYSKFINSHQRGEYMALFIMFAPIFGPFKLDVMEIEIKCVKYGIKMF